MKKFDENSRDLSLQQQTELQLLSGCWPQQAEPLVGLPAVGAHGARPRPDLVQPASATPQCKLKQKLNSAVLKIKSFFAPKIKSDLIFLKLSAIS